jgi:hypothetical protein
MVPGDNLLLGRGEGGLPLLEAAASGKHLTAQDHLANHSTWKNCLKLNAPTFR